MDYLREMFENPLVIHKGPDQQKPSQQIVRWMTSKINAHKRLQEIGMTFHALLGPALMLGWPDDPAFDGLKSILDHSEDISAQEVYKALSGLGARLNGKESSTTSNMTQTADALSASSSQVKSHSTSSSISDTIQDALLALSRDKNDSKYGKNKRRRNERAVPCEHCGGDHGGGCWFNPNSTAYRPNHPKVKGKKSPQDDTRKPHGSFF